MALEEAIPVVLTTFAKVGKNVVASWGVASLIDIDDEGSPLRVRCSDGVAIREGVPSRNDGSKTRKTYERKRKELGMGGPGGNI